MIKVDARYGRARRKSQRRTIRHLRYLLRKSKARAVRH